MRTRLGIIDREGVAAGMDRGELTNRILRRLRGEDKVTDIGYGLTLFDAHVNLTGAGVVTHGFNFFDELFGKFVRAD